MTLKHCRIALTLILAWAIFLPYFILPYIIIWFVLLEILNHQEEYKSQKNYRLYNSIFVIYVVVLFNRFMHIPLSHASREIVNRFEHLLFSFVVCMGIMQFLRLRIFKVTNFKTALILSSVIFQSIGVLNEIYQASVDVGHFRIYFSEDAVHDMLTNISGNAIFLLFAAWPQSRKKYLVFNLKEKR